MKQISNTQVSNFGNVTLFSICVTLLFIFTFAIYFVCCGKKPLDNDDYDAITLSHFNQFIITYNKTYSPAEYKQRYKNFKNFLKRVEKLNRPYVEANKTPVHGITKFADMTRYEFKRKYLSGLKASRFTTLPTTVHCNVNNESTHLILTENIPEAFDWRTYGYVGDVVQQGDCKACWAASIIGVMETMVAKQQKHLEKLSIQQLIDCDPENGRCNGGGRVIRAIKYMCYKLRGAAAEDEYPETWTNEQCRHVKPRKRWRLRSFSSEINCPEKRMLQLIAQKGPLVVEVNAHNWQSIVGDGVVQWNCSDDPKLINHAVQIVGYNLTAVVPYYIVRNSWSKDFGDDGYLKLEVGTDCCAIGRRVSSLDVIL